MLGDLFGDIESAFFLFLLVTALVDHVRMITCHAKVQNLDQDGGVVLIDCVFPDHLFVVFFVFVMHRIVPCRFNIAEL